MTKEVPEHIYFKEDIDKAFDMGVDTVVSAFEKTIGMSTNNQRILLSHIKDMLLEQRAGAVNDKSVNHYLNIR